MRKASNHLINTTWIVIVLHIAIAIISVFFLETISLMLLNTGDIFQLISFLSLGIIINASGASLYFFITLIEGKDYDKSLSRLKLSLKLILIFSLLYVLLIPYQVYDFLNIVDSMYLPLFKPSTFFIFNTLVALILTNIENVFNKPSEMKPLTYKTLNTLLSFILLVLFSISTYEFVKDFMIYIKYRTIYYPELMFYIGPIIINGTASLTIILHLIIKSISKETYDRSKNWMKSIFKGLSIFLLLLFIAMLNFMLNEPWRDNLKILLTIRHIYPIVISYFLVVLLHQNSIEIHNDADEKAKITEL